MTLNRQADIEKATVFVNGDPSVGIRSASFDLDVFFDITTDDEVLKEFREKIESVYSDMTGEPAKLLFDFEIQNMNQNGM